MKSSMMAVLIASLATSALAATPRLEDYAQGMTIETYTEKPIVQLPLPDGVYQTIASDDLSDLRVFNADGTPVPHALCAAVTQSEPTISQESLPVYRLQDIKAAADGTRVEVQTAGGAQISVEGADGKQGERQTAAYVIDARAITDELRAMQFDWSSPDGASEVRVSIQASDDLDRWRTLIASSTLLSVQAGGQQLRRHRVVVPQGHYEYLRVERVDRGPPLQLDGVIAERVSPSPIAEPMWFSATTLPTREVTELWFDTARRAPLTFARVVPTQENMSLRLAIDSRPDENATWTTRWTGEVFSIVTDSEHRVSPPAEFTPVTDRYWRLRLTNKADAFGSPPLLEMGYRPARLRFLAQGDAPFTLAFGSRRAETAPVRQCNELLANLKPEELQASIGDGAPGLTRKLGGEDALRPLPKQTPLRQIVLWGVLVIGVGALVAMALSLLRRVNADGKK